MSQKLIGCFHSSIKEQDRGQCESFLKTKPHLVNARNDMSETALHVACKHTKVNVLTKYLLEKGSDLNAQNYWGQTPLHFAAEARSIGTMKLLLRAPGIKVNCKDVNGYTVLHTFVSSSQTYDGNWKEGIRLLVDANIDINAQTNYGQTILHLAASQEDNTEFLRHFLTRYQHFDLNLRNISGENFLHVYCMSEICEECISLVQSIRTISKSVFKQLLDQQDKFGLTPWGQMLEKSELGPKSFETLIEIYRVSLNTTDNLGNTALMRRVGKTGALADHNLKILRHMIKNDVNVNCQNVFGHSAVSLLYHLDVYKELFDTKLDTKATDRWGRLPIVNLMSQNTHPDLLDAILKHHKTMVNAKDINGSTLLHFAAYHGNEEYIELLLKHNADLDARDVLGDTPFDTARRHENVKCWEVLAKAMRFKSINEHIFLYKAPPYTMNMSSLLEQPIKALLKGFPENIESYAERALVSKYNSNEEFWHIFAAVNEHVRLLCEIVSKYDSRFSMSVFNTGSTAEGTKVGAPDEFDFALCLESLNEMCHIETLAGTQVGYARLQFKADPVPDEYISFSDTRRCFLPFPFLHYLFRYIRRALSDRQLWEKGNLYTRSENRLDIISGKPVFNYSVYWNGAYYKHLPISIDLVPAVYVRGWWPSYARFENKKLVSDEVKAAGCFLLMQTENYRFDREWHKMNDSLAFTCKTSLETDREKLLKISIAPAEIALMRSLPEIYRRGYALAKIMKSNDICPKVKIDVNPPYIEGCVIPLFDTDYKSVVDPSDFIKSYWLKNCVFYMADETDSDTLRNKSSLQITQEIYQKLLDFSVSCNFRPYVFGETDLFEFERGKYGLEVFVTRRKVCIGTVLAVLGLHFPQDIQRLISTCKRNYNSKKKPPQISENK